MKRLLPTAFALLLAAAPVQAEVGIDNPYVSTPTSLYMHLIDFGDMPINTQLPDPAFTADQGYSVGTATLKCIDPLTGDVTGQGHGTGGSTSQIYHTSYGYSSPSYVEYGSVQTNGLPRTHPERGISYDAIFDKDYPFVVEWYVAVFNGGGDQDQVPTPTPGVVMAATMRAGDAISVDDRAYDSGPTLAAGRTEAAILVPSPVEDTGGAFGADGQPSQHVDYVGQVDGKHVFRFRIPMTYEADLIARATGYNLRIDMFVDNPACQKPTDVGKEYVMPSTLAGFTSADHRPRLDLAVMNPVRVEYLHPQLIGDELVIHAALNSVWGNYDVQEATPDGIQVTITGPTTVTKLTRAAFQQRTVEHYHHQEAVDIAYIWDYKADKAAADGTYTVHVEFTNDQGTAVASADGEFVFGDGGIDIGSCGGVQESTQKLSESCTRSMTTLGEDSAESPGLPVAVVLAGLAAVAVALRRRV